MLDPDKSYPSRSSISAYGGGHLNLSGTDERDKALYAVNAINPSDSNIGHKRGNLTPGNPDNR
jgi:hypothetical protein